MPRTSVANRLKGAGPIVPGATLSPPRLWNAHKRIKTGKTHPLQKLSLKELGENNEWRASVTPDIVEYIDKAKPAPEDHARILRDPHTFFSRPKNVSVEFRKQIYFPKFIVCFCRTPHLPPKYASFFVPLWFSKLDMKSYLSSVYKVEVLHVRSTVFQEKVQRDRQDVGRGVSNGGYGRLKRPMGKKRMTVELVEPFIWPEAVKDLSPWENETYWTSSKEQLAFQQTLQPDATLRTKKKHWKSIAEQAKELLEAKTQWRSTWMSIPKEARVLQGEKPVSVSEATQGSP